MGDLSKLKVAIGQIEVVEGRPSRNEAAIDCAVDAALDEGADVLVLAGSLEDEENIRLIGLNDSRVDIAGNDVIIDACGDSYRVSIGHPKPDCDFSLCSDLTPYMLNAHAGYREALGPTVVLRPVGMRDMGKRLIAYDGGSAAYRSDGSCVALLRDDFCPDSKTFTFEGAAEVAPSCSRKLLAAITETIRRFDDQVLGGELKWIIGLSGGLDSSVVAGLLVLALGPERVIAYSLSSKYNSEATRQNAASIAEKLGITLHSGSIELLVDSLSETVAEYGYVGGLPEGLVTENAQARTRGNLLSTFAAMEGGVVVNNGNRVECALGYATLYGDAIGALAPIGDLSKVELFGLARDINVTFGFEAVPENLLPCETDGGYVWETMPSAELSTGQVDPMKWFYHDWLIGKLLGDDSQDRPVFDDIACDVLAQYLDDRLYGSEVGKWIRFYGLDDPRVFADDFDWVLSSMCSSAFKRIQAPPKIALASRWSLFGADDVQVTQEFSSRYRVLMSRIRRL